MRTAGQKRSGKVSLRNDTRAEVRAVKMAFYQEHLFNIFLWVQRHHKALKSTVTRVLPVVAEDFTV